MAGGTEVNTFEIGKKYICVAKCPELDRTKEHHCCMEVTSDEAIEYLMNHDCPCGNIDKWEEQK